VTKCSFHLTGLLAALRDPRAYPFEVGSVELRQTHVSAVFLAGDYAYKIKKPVNLGFLDFSTLAKRQHFCDEEVRLNRRLAPDVYLGVVPVTRSGGFLAIEGQGEVVEWAVKMRRLPDSATLLSHLQRGEVHAELIESLARRIARFHARADSGEHVAGFGRFEVVAGNALENLTQSISHIGYTINESVHKRLRHLTDAALDRLRTLIDDRAQRQVPRDTHGDLHLDHVYLFPDRPAPGDLVVIDCIEFNERFRFADPVSDMAFLVMDLIFRARRDLAQSFAEAYFRATGDEEGRSVLPFYTAYRAAVRAKVEGMAAMEKEVPEREREQARVSARAHWLLALGELETPSCRPCLVLVAGLPGTGKSTLASGLARQAGFTVVRSDVVRKELSGNAVETKVPSLFGAGIYSSEWTERTYAECLKRAESLLFEGKRVVVDASFGDERFRQEFLHAASRWAVTGVILFCHADPKIVRTRLENRAGDPSDADWTIYLQAAKRWQSSGSQTQQVAVDIPTGDSADQALKTALAALRLRRLVDTGR
jgi:aminoglycoside phosphotransferase family enzyme/predicted kinase